MLRCCCTGWDWLCWGVDAFYSRRKTLLIYAFVFNLAAIACITAAAVAIGTTPSLSAIGWAKAATTLEDLPQCDDSSSTAKITVRVWLGLKGFYGQCDGEIDGRARSRTFTPTMHSDKHFCDGTGTRNNGTFASSGRPLCMEHLELNCELTTIGDATLPYCSTCEDTSNDCVGTLVTAAAFGIFPLVLTVRRLYSVKRERGLRLRTLFFSSIAIILGLHAFIRFHLLCATRLPSSFAALVCSKACNSGEPFLVQTPTNFVLFTGGRLVIIAACLKVSYFTIHFVTPVGRDKLIQPNAMGERRSLLPRNELFEERIIFKAEAS